MARSVSWRRVPCARMKRSSVIFTVAIFLATVAVLQISELISLPYISARNTVRVNDDDQPLPESSLMQMWAAQKHALLKPPPNFSGKQHNNAEDTIAEAQQQQEEENNQEQQEQPLEDWAHKDADDAADPAAEAGKEDDESLPLVPKELEAEACRYPPFNLNEDTIGQFFTSAPQLQCDGRLLFGYMNGQLELNTNQYAKGNPFGRCEFTPIMWKDDRSFIYGEPVISRQHPFEDVPTQEQDFFHVRCFGATANNNEETESKADAIYEQFLAQVSPRVDVIKRADEILEALGKKPSSEQQPRQMNVLIFAIESLSHMSAMRLLPRTYAYLRQHMHAVILNGFNTVGDSTTGTLIPLLTGRRQEELAEVKKDHPDASYVDIYPFAWKAFEHSGYVTLFAEDQPTYGTFQHRLNGFENLPVDHYMRPFWLAALGSSLHAASRPYCLGSKPEHQLMFDYVRQFLMRYRDQPKLAVAFLGELSRDDVTAASNVDEDFIQLFTFLKKSKVMDNLMVVVMGDHGTEHGDMRATLQGHLEQRLPFMSLTFPDWFTSNQSQSLANLMKNQERLTTPYDVHKTLMGLLDVREAQNYAADNKLGINLLTNIVPSSRNCIQAGIDIQWCTCIDYASVADDTVAQAVGRLVVHYINNATQQYRDKCNEVEVGKIQVFNIIRPRTKAKNQNEIQDQPVSSADVVSVLIIMSTAPDSATFEATLSVKLSTIKLLKMYDVSRVDSVGHYGNCLSDTTTAVQSMCSCSSARRNVN